MQSRRLFSYFLSIFFLIFLLANSCKKDEDGGTDVPQKSIQLISVSIGADMLSFSSENEGLPIDEPVVIRFNTAIDTSTVKGNISLTDSQSNNIQCSIAYLDNNKTISLQPISPFTESETFTIQILNGIEGENSEIFNGYQLQFQTTMLQMELESIYINAELYDKNKRILNINLKPEITFSFSHAATLPDIQEHVLLYGGSKKLDVDISQSEDKKTYIIIPKDSLNGYKKHTIMISEQLESENGNPFSGFKGQFYTQLDSTPKFPTLTDDELLTLIQKQTFKYFWDFGHPISGLSRERVTSDENVTSGGSGFGLMAIVVGAERGFVTRDEAITRLTKIVDFLGNAERFHGAWSHWLSGVTGKARPFSQKDNGGDLVETSYMVMGLITVKHYLNTADQAENELIQKIENLINTVEWDWYTQGGQKALYWHWSENYGWEKNMKISGYNEALITYILAASSPTHAIDADVYHEGWARKGAMKNGNSFFDLTLPLGKDYGGPLFFTHYTYLGVNPKGLSDTYADYWEQNVNHSLINRAYCIQNSKNYVGYSAQCWGLTASDGNNGYSAHSPTNDRGVITPTAAISAIPYTPEESLEAIRFFYYNLGDRLWGEYGFYDAFNFTEDWVASSFLAIDQGPIIVMIENYRSGLCWDLFMADKDVQNGLTKLGFTFDK